MGVFSQLTIYMHTTRPIIACYRLPVFDSNFFFDTVVI